MAIHTCDLAIFSVLSSCRFMQEVFINIIPIIYLALQLTKNNLIFHILILLNEWYNPYSKYLSIYWFEQKFRIQYPEKHSSVMNHKIFPLHLEMPSNVEAHNNEEKNSFVTSSSIFCFITTHVS